MGNRSLRHLLSFLASSCKLNFRRVGAQILPGEMGQRLPYESRSATWTHVILTTVHMQLIRKLDAHDPAVPDRKSVV